MRRILPILVGVLALIGILDSGYLVLDHFKNLRLEAPMVASSCESVAGACNTVAKSTQSTVLGIPNGVFGAGYFAFVLAMVILRYHTGKWPLSYILPVILTLSLAYSGYLAYTMIVSLDTLCPFCMAAHCTNAVIMGLYAASRFIDRSGVASYA
jgi:uncharacterized membrane protein